MELLSTMLASNTIGLSKSLPQRGVISLETKDSGYVWNCFIMITSTNQRGNQILPIFAGGDDLGVSSIGSVYIQAGAV